MKIVFLRHGQSEANLLLTSPIPRAVESAEILSEQLGAPIVQRNELREYDVGIYEGASDEAAWEHHHEVFDDWTARGNWNSRTPGGESFHEIVTRFASLLNEFRETHVDGSYVLVGHAGLYRTALPFVLQNVDYSWTRQVEIVNGGTIVAERKGASFICTRWQEKLVAPNEFLAI